MLTSRLVLVLCAVTALQGLVGCSSSRWRQKIIESDKRIFLYREHRLQQDSSTDREPLGLAHPASVDPRDVEALLSHLVVLETNWFANSRELPIFSQQQAREFAEPIAEALGTLGPDERLRFLVPESSFGDVLWGSTGTTGVIFCSRAESIDIAFDAIHEGINDGDGGRPEEVYFAENPTDITDGNAVIPFDGARRHVDRANMKDYPRWLTVDRTRLSSLPRVAAIREKAREATEATEVTKVTAAGEKTEVVKDPAPPENVEVETGTGDVETTPPEKDPQLEALRAKIRRLKSLRDSGDITPKEYDELRKELLQAELLEEEQ